MKKFNFKIRGNNYTTVIKSFEKNIVKIEINGTSYSVEIEQEIKTSKTPKLVRSSVPVNKNDAKITSKTLNLVKAPLPGTMFKIKVKVGDTVKIGDVLFIMEAMKMENSIQSQVDGVIKSIMVAEGDVVLQDDIIMEIE